MKGSLSASILVVDGKAENLLVIHYCLKPLGAEISEVDSTQQSLSGSVKNNIAIILLDVRTFGVDEFKITTVIRRDKQLKKTSIIVLTGSDQDPVYMNKGYDIGVVDYLLTPINPKMLLSKVSVFVQMAQQKTALEDISEELLRINKKNRWIQDSVGDGIVGLDARGHITLCNLTASNIFGEAVNSLMGEHISQFVLEDDSSIFDWSQSIETEWYLKAREGVRYTGIIGASHHKEPCSVEYSVLLNSEQHSDVGVALLVFKDVSAKKMLENKLHKVAKYDSLTRVANRTLFREFLAASIARSIRRKKHTVVMFLDLDYFKRVNDSLGHDAGDQLLISFSKRLKTCTRDGDMTARLGGDEFAVILDDVGHPDDSKLVVEKMLKAINVPYLVEGQEICVGASIGIAAYPQSGKGPDDIIKAADRAMYAVKKDGRNGYKLYSELSKSIKRGRFAQVTTVAPVQTSKGPSKFFD